MLYEFVLQCLSHLLIFHPGNKKLMNDNIDNKLLKEWINLNNSMWRNTRSEVVSTKEFIDEFINELNKNNISFSFDQNDSEEFYTLFDFA